MSDKIKPGMESKAASIRKFFATVQRAKGDIGGTLPGEGIKGFPEAWAGLTLLEQGCREAYAAMKVSK